MRDFLLALILLASIESCSMLQNINKKLLPMPPAEQPNSNPDTPSNPQAQNV